MKIQNSNSTQRLVNEKAALNLKSPALALLTALGVAFTAPTWADDACEPILIGSNQYDLLAGQHTDAGDVSLEVIGDNLVVTYQTEGAWVLNEVHLWVGSSLTLMPQTKKGNPIPGQFPQKANDINDNQISFEIPLADLDFQCPNEGTTYVMAAHASLTNTATGASETGWSDGGEITSGKNWSTASSFTLGCQCPDGDPDEPEVTYACETAFAYAPSDEGGTCFLNMGFDRWGWTLGTLSEGDSRTYDLYAGAGQCDTTKGELVGTVSVKYLDGQANVRYSTDYPYTLDETHLYLGNDQLPSQKKGKNVEYTVAPGQYGNTQDLDETMDTTSSYTLDASGEINLVAHAVSCKPE